MFGMRVLIFLLGIGLVVWILMRLYKSPVSRTKPKEKVGDMVKCEHCGVFIPRTNAIGQGNQFYCSKEHQEKDQ